MTTSDPWPAPRPAQALDAVVFLPGSKSLTNRYLVIGALATDVSRLRRPLRSRDTLLMARALATLGATITDLPGEDGGPADWLIEPGPLAGPADIDCGLAGTVMRFLPPVAALATGAIAFDGDPAARRRPMRTGIEALRRLGVRVDAAEGGLLPLTVHGTGRVRGGEITLDASASSQFISGMLLAGARFDEGLTVVHDGPPVPSEPHIIMTTEVLRDAGVEIDDSEADRWRVEPCDIYALDVQVEPDLSSAATFLAAAMVTGGRLHVPGWPQHTTQGGDAIRDIFDAMGGSVSLSREGLTVEGPDVIHGLDVDLHDAGELTPVVTAVAALADSPSTIRGVGHLRGHETDRLSALAAELGGLGGDVTVNGDDLRVRPRPLHGGLFRSYADHRMAMAGAVVGLAVPGVLVDDIATTDKTMPDFVERWLGMLGAGEPAGGTGATGA